MKQSPKCATLLCAPGNAGIAKIVECHDLDIIKPEAVLSFARENSVDFVIVGPEAPLVAGVAEVLRKNSILTFGPDKAAAQLEASKNFTKEICSASGVPTAVFRHFTYAQSAKDYLHV